MIYFIKSRNYNNSNNHINLENRRLMDIKTILDNVGYSNILLYNKVIPHKLRSINHKRKCINISSLNLNLINQKSIIVLHSEIIDEKLSELVKHCLDNNKYLFLFYDPDKDYSIIVNDVVRLYNKISIIDSLVTPNKWEEFEMSIRRDITIDNLIC